MPNTPGTPLPGMSPAWSTRSASISQEEWQPVPSHSDSQGHRIPSQKSSQPGNAAETMQNNTKSHHSCGACMVENQASQDTWPMTDPSCTSIAANTLALKRLLMGDQHDFLLRGRSKRRSPHHCALGIADGAMGLVLVPIPPTPQRGLLAPLPKRVPSNKTTPKRLGMGMTCPKQVPTCRMGCDCQHRASETKKSPTDSPTAERSAPVVLRRKGPPGTLQSSS